MLNLEKARKQYDSILHDRECRALDPGEFEELKQRWFDDHALALIEAMEDREQVGLERSL